MWILALLALVLSRLARAVHNETIDDASALITYKDATLQRNITAFDSRLLWDGTVTYIVPIPDSSPTITIPFTGTAIYIFVAYPGRVEPAPSGFTVLIDGVPSGNWAAKESALLYHHLVYHNSTLPDASHTLVMQIMLGWEFYFDYAVYTSNVDPPVESPTSTTNSASSSGSTPQSPSTTISTPTIVLTVAGDASTIDILSAVTQPAETSTSIAVSISGLTQTLSGPTSTVSASGLTLSGTSPAVGGTSQAAGAAAATSSNITTIIRMAGNLPAIPMIGAFLGGVLFGGLVMLVCLILLRRRRTRKRKRAPWIFNAAGFGFDERRGTGEKGDRREKYKSATEFGEPGFEITEDAEVLARVRAEMRWHRASVQRLETDIPEGHVGGSLERCPPTYGELS
ncbi:hypothetical protein B0H14DRAFT_265737 [Mycena olivaceomarginata]|nr:hypothetical protein B0H14DRAFT_830138 [Mycena olivaceomarginata]KAJ7869901.1 hypothetical protein B0H14DRAFT_265737 [Mycena olivaceomarginata]